MKRFFVIFFLVFSLIGLKLKNQNTNDKVQIITSVFPLKEFAQAVSGERGEVHLLLPPGAEIHTWRPRPSDIIRLSSADLFIYVGSNLEPWLHDVLKSVKNPDLVVLEASRSLSVVKEDQHDHKHEGYEHLENHSHDIFDPHIWLDFGNDQKIINNIVKTLSIINPQASSVYEKNASLYKDKLQKLDQEFENSLKDCQHRTFILGGHAAFGYLARRYDLHQISLYGLSPDSRPTPKQLIEVVQLAKKHKIDVIFFELYVSDKLAKTIADEVGARVLVLNPGANLTQKQLDSGITFFDLMEENLENLKDGLNCH